MSSKDAEGSPVAAASGGEGASQEKTVEGKGGAPEAGDAGVVSEGGEGAGGGSKGGSFKAGDKDGADDAPPSLPASPGARRSGDGLGVGGNEVDPGELEEVEDLREELRGCQAALQQERVRCSRAEEAEKKLKEEQSELIKSVEEAKGGSTDGLVAKLRERAERAEGELEDTRKKLAELEEYTNHIDEQFTQMQVKLMAERKGSIKVSPVPEDVGEGDGGQDSSLRVLRMIDDKNALIADLKSRVKELEGGGSKTDRPGRRVEEGEASDGEGGEIPYDVLDRLDDELAQARELLLHKDAEIDSAKASEAAARAELKDALDWKERAVQAQQAGSVSTVEVSRLEKELDEERGMRRALEARFDEKLKLKVREVESLSSEVMRLKRNGEQLGPVLAELERCKAEFRDKQEQRDKEVRRLQSSLAMSETDRQKAEGRVAALAGEMAQFETKVKNSEEVRWRAGMNLAKAKAEMDWRMRADQEKDFLLERMKDELDRLKGKVMRSEMRKLKVEESLEEAVLELRSKKREMQHMRHRVEGIVKAVQAHQQHGAPMLEDRGRMHAELYPR